MKAQLSLEFLMVFAVFLAVLLLAVGAISKISYVEERAKEKAFGELALSDMSSAANSACVLGNGNVRVVKMPDNAISFSFSGNEISASCGNWSGITGIECEVSGGLLRTAGGNVTIENRAGVLYFS